MGILLFVEPNRDPGPGLVLDPPRPSDEAATEQVAAPAERAAPAEESKPDGTAPAPAVGQTPVAPPQAPPAEPAALPAETPEDTPAQPEDASGQSVADPAQAEAVPPAPEDPPARFDVVRVDVAGNALVAGRASPGDTVRILLDGSEVFQTRADASGDFVALFTIAPSAQARAIGLAVGGEDSVPKATGATALLSPFGVTPEPAPVVEAPDRVVADAPDAPAETAPEAAVPGEIATAEAPGAPAAQAQAPTVVLIEDGRVRPAVQAAPAAPVTGELPAVIETISYDARGDVILAGRATPKAPVRLYLDNAAAAEGRAAADGTWSVTLSDVAPGIYTLRLDAFGADGRVRSRFETPFQRTAPEVALAALRQGAAPVPDQTPVASANPAAANAPQPVDRAGTATDTDAVVTDGTAALQPGVAGAVVQDPPVPSVITVQPGFTLWAIAENRYGDGLLYVQVYTANSDQIRDPDLIYPGQVFTLPE